MATVRRVVQGPINFLDTSNHDNDRRRHEVTLTAAALQFSMRDPRITSTICGISQTARIKETLAWAAYPIPDGFWAEVTALPWEAGDPEATRVYRPG